GSGTAGYGGDGVAGGALAAQFNAPSCVVPIPAASGGGVFVCDQVNNAIRRVTASNTATAGAGTGAAGSSDAPAATAQLNGPIHASFDAGGNLLIVDRGNNRIRRLDLGSDTLSTVAGTGDDAASPDGSPAATSALSGPTS